MAILLYALRRRNATAPPTPTSTNAPGAGMVAVATIDNLLKGAASQAIQNINLACGHDPLEGLVT